MLIAQVQRLPSSDEIAAGFQPDRTTDPSAPGTSLAQTDPRLQASNWQVNTERSARSMLSGLSGPHILMLSTRPCAGNGFAATAPEWHASTTSLALVAQNTCAGRPLAVAAKKKQVHQRLLTASIGTQAREALSTMPITKSQMAAILGIERPHLYAWLADKVERPAKGERLSDLLKALAAAGISSQHPLRGHLLTTPLEPGAPTLLALLKGKDLGSATIASALATAVRLNRDIDNEAARRQAQMKAAGHEAPSDDEAQATLDATLTSMEWDNA